ncbi:carbon-nitrogen hydrolase family protein [Agathobaculum sp. NTUH-O15-33]|uniref:carbon-nitrogen hydrolase family protein n=1 Tax=Agathobaculum sp. NTUH-O15-33 TaxID=3079302 RepID=UPI00295863E3|nr:carbon-nitrogen hydrolase family protein [Agathobaculum sp. NTUH-O15-33]WNX84439.1 carbon-nitrogen hydrolase family protein [Agathobaculum sp. NTUH-O15-33]
MATACVTLSVINFQAVWGDKDHNLQRILEYSEQACRAGSKIVLFPEMSLTGHADDPNAPAEKTMQQLLAEPVPGPSSDAVEKAAIANRLYIAFGMPVRRGGAVYNSLVVCGPQGLVGQYDKLHLAGAEPHWASQGEKLPLLFETPYGKIMCSLSYDSFCFPEMYRYACAKGASLVLNAAACAAPEMRAAYQQMLGRHAGLNSIHIATANLTGPELAEHYFGGSHILSPAEPIEMCKVVAGCAFTEETATIPAIATAVIDLTGTMPHYPYFERNPRVGAPDWRPALYEQMYDAVLKDADWRGMYQA